MHINNNSNNKQFAYEFIKFVLSNKQQMKIETNDIQVNVAAFEKYMEKAKLYIGSETDNKENYIRVLKIISDI